MLAGSVIERVFGDKCPLFVALGYPFPKSQEPARAKSP